MDVAFVQNAQDDVNGDQSSENENRLVGERAQEGRGGALERSLNAGRHADFLLGVVYGVYRVTERSGGGEVERDRNDGKLPLVINGEWRERRLKACERAERYLR